MLKNKEMTTPPDYRLEESLSKEIVLEMTTPPDSSEHKPHDNNGIGKILNASVCRITDKQRNKDSVTKVSNYWTTIFVSDNISFPPHI